MSPGFQTHEIFNQSAPFSGVNLFLSDPALMGLLEGLPSSLLEELTAAGAFWGSAEAQELGRLANANAPALKTHDPRGERIDAIEFHPSYHALMRRGVAAGLHCSVWDAAGAEAPVRTTARAARLFLVAQAEASHLGAMTTSNAAVAALAYAPSVIGAWLPSIRSRSYDHSQRPATEKRGTLIGLGLAEKQGGSDIRSNTVLAEADGADQFRLTGHKWFLSAPSSDAFVVTGKTQEGLSAFLMPRFQIDGTRNRIRLLRLKNKLGNRAEATAEIEFDNARGTLIGEVGRGAAAIMEMLTLIRLDCAVVSAALMRAALAEAAHHIRRRAAFGDTLIDQPLMVRVLADVALDVTAAAALAFRLAESFDRANDDPAEAAFARLMTPVTKYWVTKIAPMVIAEAMECLGGNGYIEESRLPMIYREAPANAIWDSPGNVMCRDVVQVLRRSSDPLESVLAGIEKALGAGAKTTLNVLRAAAAVALADEGSARVLTEQLALSVAAATLHRRFPAAVADAFVASRLNRQWRSTYGMLDSRFDARAFIDFVCPP